MLYLYIKALHIVLMTCWMAALWYLGRLFIYHTEAKAMPKETQRTLYHQFSLMEGRLWRIIALPAMLLTLTTGLSLLYLNPALLHQDWMVAKLCFVGALLWYHFVCWRQLTKIGKEIFSWTAIQLRIWNEVPTLLLVCIVFLVVLKSIINWIYGLISLLLLGIITLSLVKIRNHPTKKQ